MRVAIEHFTDPACPFAYSAEPSRYRLRWLFGDGLRWDHRMIVLSEDTADMEARGFTPERLAGGLRSLQEQHGMPIATHARERLSSSVLACRAVVAARLHPPAAEEPVLRRLRIAAMSGALLDDPETVLGAGEESGLDRSDLGEWLADPAVEEAMRADMRAARSPAPAARALDHKLAGPRHERRYTAPSYVLHADDGETLEAPGFQPVAVYEALLANLAPELERRAEPESVEEVLAWAGEPLATVEVAAVLGVTPDEARGRLAEVAEPSPIGDEAFWALAPAAAAA